MDGNCGSGIGTNNLWHESGQDIDVTSFGTFIFWSYIYCSRASHNLISLMAYQSYFILSLDRGLQDAQPLGVVALLVQLGFTVIFTQGSLAE